MPVSKRNLAALAAKWTGAIRVLELLPAKPLLLVLNYHRIGYSDATPYDPGVYSATPEQFDKEVAFVKKRFEVLTLTRAINIVEGTCKVERTCVLLTFDDGYTDNYEIAFPILLKHGLPAAFFLPTSFVGTTRLPWWDRIALIVKHSRKQSFRLAYPEPAEFNIPRHGLDHVLRKVMRIYTGPDMRDEQRFLAELAAACEVEEPGETDRCFLSWEEVRHMLGRGMAIGSHAHSHGILSKMTETEQYEELMTSRRILERQLGTTVTSLAYPVGAPGSYSAATASAAARAGYRVAFSFNGGFNHPGSMDRYDVRRHAVDYCATMARFQLQTNLASITGKYWF